MSYNATRFSRSVRHVKAVGQLAAMYFALPPVIVVGNEPREASMERALLPRYPGAVAWCQGRGALGQAVYVEQAVPVMTRRARAPFIAAL